MNDYKAFRSEMRHAFAVSRPSSFAKITNPAEPPLDEAIAELREQDPDGYANLAEFLPLRELEDKERERRGDA